MDNLECRVMDTRDAYGRERFLPMVLESHLTQGITDNTWFMEIHPSFYKVKTVSHCYSGSKSNGCYVLNFFAVGIRLLLRYGNRFSSINSYADVCFLLPNLSNESAWPDR